MTTANRTSNSDTNSGSGRDLAHDHALLDRIDHYQDALHRPDARAEDFGPLTLFVRDGSGPPLHARPTRGRPGSPVTAADVRRVRARQRELSLPETFEWVAQTTPGLRKAAEEAGLRVEARPLLVLPEAAPVPAARTVPTGTAVRTLTPDDPCLPSAVTTPWLAFAELGTHIGETGAAELAEAIPAYTAEITRTADRIRAGRTTVVAAIEDGLALCSGLFPRPVGGVTELCAVATLPAARRRGLALAVTAALAAEARGLGVKTVFLCATDETVARIYARLGFRHAATFMEARPEE
ncbi:GNAT family N-acetyltransferase [Streptomyces sp. AK02-01A]|uniref:GNAT family N-acetyltransferase n=1 Tax=Streptomyces sp. AK02-01A TaxID=3028648 RepID=UPI0029A98342|nr:GNAT family N-acetyltransferase [Streptomyces sp. AK02-01A]MDX3849540.1 GNAT family N-acetyltransferase [Streptomyces sp. AK02-01A]MDX3849890.1 GNAT family N-acetyltransferase [Streptomyces sp. AK02-01A]